MNQIIRLSISEAAKIFGISEKTVRRAIKNHEVLYIVVGGRYKITFESLIRWSQEKTITKNKLKKQGIGQFVEKWSIKNPSCNPQDTTQTQIS